MPIYEYDDNVIPIIRKFSGLCQMWFQICNIYVITVVSYMIINALKNNDLYTTQL